MDSDKHNLANQNKNIIKDKNMPSIDSLSKKHRKGDKVDIVKLAKSLGLGVFAKNMPDSQSGYILEDGSPRIVVNRTHPITRQRFTIAHEVAHFLNDRPLLKSVGQLDRNSAEENSDIERAADKLAAELLMPTFMIREFFDKKQWTQTTNFTARMVEEIAKTFEVSRAMAVTRLRETGCELPYLSFA